MVYIIRVGITPAIGEAFAYNIEDEGAAWNATLIWLRGYKTAKSEIIDVRNKRFTEEAVRRIEQT